MCSLAIAPFKPLFLAELNIFTCLFPWYCCLFYRDIIEDTPLVDMLGDKPCYNPDGTLSEDDVPCTSEQNTHCCGKSSICLTNGYCLGADAQPFGLSRGSCTNQNWATGCPQRCWSMDSLPVFFFFFFHSICQLTKRSYTEYDGDNKHGGCPIISIDYNKGWQYCCGNLVSNNNEVQCAANTEDRFLLDATQVIPGVGMLSNLSNFYVSGSAPNSSIIPSPSPSPRPNLTASISSNNSGTASHDTAIGVGVGVPLGVIALVFLVWALLERKRAQDTSTKLAEVMSGIPSGGGYQMKKNPHVAVELGATQSMPAELGQTQSVPELMGRTR